MRQRHMNAYQYGSQEHACSHGAPLHDLLGDRLLHCNSLVNLVTMVQVRSDQKDAAEMTEGSDEP